MVTIHEEARGQFKKIEKQLLEMPKKQRNGSVTGVAYCAECLLPAIENKSFENEEGVKIEYKECAFCQKPVKMMIASRTRYRGILKQVKEIYLGLRKNK